MTRLNPPRPMILIDSKSFIEMSRFYVKLVPGCGFISRTKKLSYQFILRKVNCTYWQNELLRLFCLAELKGFYK